MGAENTSCLGPNLDPNSVSEDTLGNAAHDVCRLGVGPLGALRIRPKQGRRIMAAAIRHNVMQVKEGPYCEAMRGSAGP